jgi:hypothetical protein
MRFPAPMREARVAADGAAALWPLPVEHEVEVAAPGYTCMPVLIPCRKHARDDLEFALAPLPADLAAPSTRVRGQVVDQLGAPLANVMLRARSAGHLGGPVATAADGTFELDVPVRSRVLFRVGLAAAEWHIGNAHAELEGDGLVWLTVGADPTTQLRLHALRAGAIRGTLRNPAGSPIGAASVQVQPLTPKGERTGSRVLTATDPAGRIEVTGLPTGSYQVVVHGTTGVEGTARVDVPAAGEGTPGPMTFAPVGEVRGVLLGEEGRPLAGVPLTLRADITRKGGAVRHMLNGKAILTDRNGRFRAPGLGVGRWGIVLGDDPRGALAEMFQVEEGASVELELKGAR